MLAMPLRAQKRTQESQCARDLRVVSTTRSSSPVGNSPNVVGKASDTASCGGKVTRSQPASARRSPMRPQATPPRAGRQNARSRAASATQLPHPAGEAKRTGGVRHHRALITTAAISRCGASWPTLWASASLVASARGVRREFIGQRHYAGSTRPVASPFVVCWPYRRQPERIVHSLLVHNSRGRNRCRAIHEHQQPSSIQTIVQRSANRIAR
jgi:hypothetical protein